MTPYERLLAEAIPVRPPAHEDDHTWTRPPGQTWTRQEQDAHWTTLCNAIGAPGTPRPAPTTQPIE